VYSDGSVHELQFANYATQFAMSIASLYEVGQSDLTLGGKGLDCAHDQLTLEVIRGRLKTQVRKTKVPGDGICKYGKRKYESAMMEKVSTAT